MADGGEEPEEFVGLNPVNGRPEIRNQFKPTEPIPPVGFDMKCEEESTAWRVK